MADHAIDPATLPRLLYIADVPVENSLHGSSLLYRLLLRYPANRLMIVETGAHASLPERRLPGVAYRFVAQPLGRLLRTRLSKLAASATLFMTAFRARAIRAATADFAADAILTVTNGDAWRCATLLASERGIPYHLICHDEWASGGSTPAWLRHWKAGVFGKAYRAATSRLCVSPAMVATYLARYGVMGTTLYPARSSSSVTYDGLSPRMAAFAGGRIVAFAGSMSTATMVEANLRLAEAIAPLGGTLMIFGPATSDQSRFDRPNIILRGLLTPDALSAALRSEVDVLFLPMWFGSDEKDNERLSFPSKLTEYTNVGLPILVSGDAECAAAAWERANPGVALVLMSQTVEKIAADVQRLFEDRDLAVALATRAKQVGDAMFSPHVAEQILYSALVTTGSKR